MFHVKANVVHQMADEHVSFTDLWSCGCQGHHDRDFSFSLSLIDFIYFCKSDFCQTIMP